MNEEDNFVVCGQDLAELKPTAELRWELRWMPNPRLGASIAEQQPILQQKWVASAKMPDGGMWEEARWRDVPVSIGQ